MRRREKILLFYLVLLFKLGIIQLLQFRVWSFKSAVNASFEVYKMLIIFYVTRLQIWELKPRVLICACNFVQLLGLFLYPTRRLGKIFLATIFVFIMGEQEKLTSVKALFVRKFTTASGTQGNSFTSVEYNTLVQPLGINPLVDKQRSFWTVTYDLIG